MGQALCQSPPCCVYGSSLLLKLYKAQTARQTVMRRNVQPAFVKVSYWQLMKDFPGSLLYVGITKGFVGQLVFLVKADTFSKSKVSYKGTASFLDFVSVMVEDDCRFYFYHKKLLTPDEALCFVPAPSLATDNCSQEDMSFFNRPRWSVYIEHIWKAIRKVSWELVITADWQNWLGWQI